MHFLEPPYALYYDHVENNKVAWIAGVVCDSPSINPPSLALMEERLYNALNMEAIWILIR
jgi:hypothetical protein